MKWNKIGRREQVEEVCRVARMLTELELGLSGNEWAMLELAAARRLGEVEKSYKKGKER